MSKSDSPGGVQEIQKMLIGYAKQETIDPLKSLGRYLGFGVFGAFFVTAGVLFMSLGALRFTQTLSSIDDGSIWKSTLPYLAAIGALIFFLIIIFITLTRAKKKVGRHDRANNA